MSSAESMTTAFEAIAQKAWATNRARVAELTTLIAEWRRVGELTAEQREHAGTLAHSLRGSAGTFGHDEASSAAGELETLLSRSGQDGQPERFAVIIERIDAALACGPVLER